jgi:hypothetical protein
MALLQKQVASFGLMDAVSTSTAGHNQGAPGSLEAMPILGHKTTPQKKNIGPTVSRIQAET